MEMRMIPEEYRFPVSRPGKVTSLAYGRKYALLYTPGAPARDILYLIHGGGGNQHSFFCPEFLNLVDHMIADGVMPPVYMVSPCFYDPDETDKSPASSGVAVAKFCKELRDEIIPLAEGHIGVPFGRKNRAIGGFSMGGVMMWYAFLQALDLFYWFLPLSGDCWICGETGGAGSRKRRPRSLLPLWSGRERPISASTPLPGRRTLRSPIWTPRSAPWRNIRSSPTSA